MSIKKQVVRFWKIFESERKNLETALIEHNHEEVEEIKKILATYFEEMCNCELTIEEEDGIFEITFLPEQEKNAQIICALLKQLAPSSVKTNWVIHDCLPPLSQKALHTILRLNNQEYSGEDFSVYYEIDTQNHCLDIEIYCDAFVSMEVNKAMEIAVYMTQLFIGEVALEAYINHIEVIDTKKSGNVSLLPYFYEMLLDIVSEQKWSEYNDATKIYRAYKLEEEKVSNEVRKDMKMVFTIHPLMIGETFSKESFIANQFFDLGGEYGYLYYEHANSEVNDALVRQKLEQKLNELLYPIGIARSIGGAIGTKYVYIDLAIFDKEDFLKVLPKINEKLSIKLHYAPFE
ncbi:MAG: hypothetical protein EOM50_16010 [Erysipelotrichia bacterium]|nr:hypothetical protein [Erysipelotrichia bacterium]NCC53939.1 hypothetical protein [Erysipelotrichia bacterium]